MPREYKRKINYYLTHPDEDIPKLNELERKIIEMRLGIGAFKFSHSLKDITQELSRKHTHTWARDRINKILKKVRYDIKND